MLYIIQYKSAHVVTRKPFQLCKPFEPFSPLNILNPVNLLNLLNARCRLHLRLSQIAERGFDLRTSWLWAQDANHCANLLNNISGMAQWLACWAHNPKIRGSKPRSAICNSRGCSRMTPVGFEPTQLGLVEPQPSPLDK